MRILGVDTATWRASAGILIDGEVVAEQSQMIEGSHAVSLLGLIDSVLQRAGCAVDALDAIAVSSGPGSFSGLRIGLSTAKGLACATGARLVGVATLEALARTVATHHGVICSLLDARKGELYAAWFESSPHKFQCLSADALITLESLIETLPTPCIVLGDAVPTYGRRLQDSLGAHVTLLPFDTYGPRGGVIAAMGEERLLGGHTDAVSDLEPFYIRPSDAERKSQSTG